MNPKRKNAPQTTVTFDRKAFTGPDGNIYEVINILAKRARQINAELKAELMEKLDEFATQGETLEEVFENHEQIEVSKYYERLPKPTAMAVQELLEDEIYSRSPDEKE